MIKTTVLKIDLGWSLTSTKDKIHPSHNMSLAGQAKRWKDRNFGALSLSRSFVRQRVLRLLAAICRENENNFRSNNGEITGKKPNNKKKK